MYAIRAKITSRGLLCSFTYLLISFFTSQLFAEESSSGLGSAIIEENITADAADNDEQNPDNALPLIYEQELAFEQKLASESKPEEVVWLNIKYPGVASSRQALALKTSFKSAKSHGAALIIPDTQQHANWPGLVRTLREYLAYEGWMSLAINLPWPGMEPIPKRDLETKSFASFTPNENTTRASALGARAYGENKAPVDEPTEQESTESDSESVDIDLKAENNSIASLPPYHERALIHVHSGMEFLAQQGFQNIVLIGIKESADLVIDYVQSRETEITDKGLTVILIEPSLSENRNDEFSKALGERFPAPILDIYRSTSIEQKDKARLRAASSQRGSLMSYTQLKIASPTDLSIANSMLKRMTDWLELTSPGEKKRNGA